MTRDPAAEATATAAYLAALERIAEKVEREYLPGDARLALTPAAIVRRFGPVYGIDGAAASLERMVAVMPARGPAA